ncbi:MAG TPA: class I SAM-dependent methyltransferase [Hyphomicrobiaceae bacterium]|jgi:SAM-dependent methyltransferase|nr:class I SAM-dependent methyltransferase [Hyphomicrobiaceae bacterium]
MAGPAGRLSPEDAERLRAFERSQHDARADSYQDFFAPITALAIAPLLAAVRLSPGMALLDVATGCGYLAAEAASRGARVVAADLSPGMLEKARALHPDLDFRVADVEHLPVPDGTFDAVACAFGVGHFPEPEAAVAECVRTLKPGGRIALSWWAEPHRQRVQGLFRDAIAEVGAQPPPDMPKGHSPLRFCDADELRRLLRGAGLAGVEVTDHEGRHMLRDVDTLWRGGLGSLVMSTAAILHQDAATQAVIRAALERRAAVYQTPGGLELPIAFRIASGRSGEEG